MLQKFIDWVDVGLCGIWVVSPPAFPHHYYLSEFSSTALDSSVNATGSKEQGQSPVLTHFDLAHTTRARSTVLARWCVCPPCFSNCWSQWGAGPARSPTCHRRQGMRAEEGIFSSPMPPHGKWECVVTEFFYICLFLHYVYGSFDCMHVQMCMQCTCRSEEGTRCPGAGVRDSCKPPCGCWESNFRPL